MFRFHFVVLWCIILLSCIQVVLSRPLPSADSSKPPFFILVGDSTTASTQTWKDGKPPGGGGWGDGFLATLQNPAGGVNHGHNGQTTVSYRQKGFWAEVVKEVEKRRVDKDVWVTVQFGHNDQKSDKGISTAQLEANLEKMVKELRDLKATAILVTPLTRRNFGSGDKLSDSLANEAKATTQAASSTKTVVIDLNAHSKKYVESISKSEATKYNADYSDSKSAGSSKDNTHLNKHGSAVFGRMVADLILEQVPELGKWVKKDAAMSASIRNGKPAR